MRYVVKQKIFSLTDSFSIKDENGNNVLMVQRQFLSFGKKLRIFDLSGNELCYIEQQVFRFMPEYNIYIGGQLVANVKKKFNLLKNDFVINSPGAQFYVEGNFFGHDFNIIQGGRIIARISKEYFTFGDTYGVEIDDDQDQLMGLALAIVIDMVCHDHHNH